MEHNQEPRKFVLPIFVFGSVEVRRLKRELESIEEYMRQVAVRESGRQPVLPRMSRLCESLASENHYNLLVTEQRQQLKKNLITIESTAPVINISFAADPSSAFTAKIVTWLRQNIHPYALLHLGLQPTIAAGCIVRTNNKVFDFSLRQQLEKAQTILMQSFESEAAHTAPAPQSPATAAAPQQPVQTPQGAPAA
jgi:F0F1-type ATP synthase delta subunit